MVKSARPAVSALTLMLLAGLPAFGQSTDGGTIRGSITDREFGVPVAGATVSILGTRARVQTSESGSFTLPNVAPGTYTVVVTKDGYTREVRANVVVSGGQLTDVDASLAGEFEEMDEVVAQDVNLEQQESEPIQVLTPPEIAPPVILQPGDFTLRLESPQLLDILGVETISRSGAGDAAAALLLVPGATLQEGKYAVVRGLPDRYVSVLLDSVRLPVSTPGKRAVQLDQFPSAVIESIQVSKSFTPDMQGEASGGGVNVVLRDIPDEPILQFRAQYGTNSQVKNGSFLTYPGGKLDYWGNNDVLQTYPELNGQSWPGNPTGTQTGSAPPIYKWSTTAGDSWEVDDDLKIGAFGNFFYDAGASYFSNGVLDSLVQEGPGRSLTPQVNGDVPDPSGDYSGQTFDTQLFDVTQGTQSVQWGGMGSFGVETSEHKLGTKFIYTRLAESQAVLLEDTRGKYFFFPNYDVAKPDDPGNQLAPNAAPWQRLETLDYTQVTTQALIFNGEHRLDFLGPGENDPIPEPLGFGAPKLDWRFSLSKASESQPDQTQFASYWTADTTNPVSGDPIPATWVGNPPAQLTDVGWVQHINYDNQESSSQGALNIKVPFLQWNDREGYVKTGMFIDSLDRTYDQDTFQNQGDTNTTFAGQWDSPWSQVFPGEVHPMFQSDRDISYDGNQLIAAGYGMIDLPFTDTMNVVGGVRYETTAMTTTVRPDENAVWLDPNDPSQTPLSFTGAPIWNADIEQANWLPMIGWNWNMREDLVLRLAFAQTLARPNFFEIVPVVQYEYVGGPTFIGNPQVQLSSLDNYDARLDWTPEEGWLISGSVFYKTIDQPIQYVQRFASFAYTTAVNYPDATLFGTEIEARVTAEPLLGEDFKGLAGGLNFTYMTSEVTLSAQDASAFSNYGVNLTSVPMTGTPDYLFNANVTYDFEPWGTQLGLFYNYQGKSLISAATTDATPSPPAAPGIQTGTLLVPSIYQLGYSTLNFTLRQPLLWGFAFNFAAKNLTNPVRETQYETVDGQTGINSSYTAGVDLQFGLSFQLIF
jgi:TonB dependent receptor/Carboxypeptidase regulatory-like domain/TonB-dependent Receptor Plug Domain